MSTNPKPFITPEQYLAIEAKAERKSEYYKGEMFLMAGASFDHNLIVANLGRVLGNEFLDKPCFVLISETRVKVSATGLYTYPDLTLVCGDRDWEDAARTTLLNPAVIIEVLSDSTEAYDRGEKFRQYRNIPSLREYLLVSQKSISVEQFIRQPGSEWSFRSYDSIDATLELPAVGCSISLREIYRKTELTGRDR
jgi:Uma2 family endonuclease